MIIISYVFTPVYLLLLLYILINSIKYLNTQFIITYNIFNAYITLEKYAKIMLSLNPFENNRTTIFL